MTARSALRSATAADHRQVDDIFSRFRLGEANGYRAFLRGIAAAHVPVEAKLEASGAARLVPDWDQRRRRALLCQDLEALGERCPPEGTGLTFSGQPELLGGIYVLEGSRLGGALLRREVPDHLPKGFLSAPSSSASWRRLAGLLDQYLAESQSLASAIDAARRVFRSFAAAGLVQLERSA